MSEELTDDQRRILENSFDAYSQADSETLAAEKEIQLLARKITVIESYLKNPDGVREQTIFNAFAPSLDLPNNIDELKNILSEAKKRVEELHNDEVINDKRRTAHGGISKIDAT